MVRDASRGKRPFEPTREKKTINVVSIRYYKRTNKPCSITISNYVQAYLIVNEPNLLVNRIEINEEPQCTVCLFVQRNAFNGTINQLLL